VGRGGVGRQWGWLLGTRENVPRRLIRSEAVIKFQDKNGFTYSVLTILCCVIMLLRELAAVKH
jgi:hypothetical protein